MLAKLFCLFVLLYSLGEVESSRHDLHEMMFWKLDSNAACFRRLNGTHQFGCSSKRGGDIGVIYIIKEESDIQMFLDTPLTETYVIVLYMEMFTREVVQSLIKHEKVGGLLVVVQNSSIPMHYSPDNVCPNSLETPCSSKKPWNRYGNDFLFTDWPFPMFMVDDEKTINAINECYIKFNIPLDKSLLSSHPLCSLQIKSHMSAAVNSPTCMRRISYAGVNIMKYCDPMGDQNIILPLGSWNENPASVILVTARLDTASLFDGIAPGAMTSVTSFVTLLTTAHIFSSIIKNQDTNGKIVLFTIFNGEAHDYIGSSRFIYDLRRGHFSLLTSMNFTMESIETVIDISQIGSNSTLFLHPTDFAVTENIRLMEELTKIGLKYSLSVRKSKESEIPPSSLRVFHKSANNSQFSGILVTSYDDEFTNRYYNGLLDNAEAIGYRYANGSLSDIDLQRNIAALSVTIAKTLYKAATGLNYDKVVQLDENILLVDELLHCFLQSRNCKLIKEVVNTNEEGYSSTGPLPLYVGVQPSSNRVTTLTGLLLAYLTADSVKLSQQNCSTSANQKVYSLIWLNGFNKTGICINTTLKFTPAVSPAFLIPEYDWASREYSTWTESIWLDINLGMFLKPSRKQEIVTFSCGLTISALSILSIFWINKQSVDIFFTPSPTSC